MRPCLAGMVIERELRLSLVWHKLSAPRAIIFETLGEFTTPASVFLSRIMQNCRPVELIDAVDANIRIRSEIHSCGDVRGFFPDGRSHRKGRIAKITGAYARRQYCATLRTSFSHRLFCAADASTPVRREHLKNTIILKCQSEK